MGVIITLDGSSEKKKTTKKDDAAPRMDLSLLYAAGYKHHGGGRRSEASEDMAPSPLPSPSPSPASAPQLSRRVDADPSRLTTFPVPGFFSSTLQLVKDTTVDAADQVATAVSNRSPPVSASQYWMPDHLCKVCYDCGESFSFFRRRHHCRLCGQIFCHNCSNRFIDGTMHGFSGVIRICAFCAKYVARDADKKLQNGGDGRRGSIDNSGAAAMAVAVATSVTDASAPGSTPSLTSTSAFPTVPKSVPSSASAASPFLFSPVDVDAASSLSFGPNDSADSLSMSSEQQDSFSDTLQGPPPLYTIHSDHSISGEDFDTQQPKRRMSTRPTLSRMRRSSVELLDAIESSTDMAVGKGFDPLSKRPTLTQKDDSFRFKKDAETQREVALDAYMQSAHKRVRAGVTHAADCVIKNFVDDGMGVKYLSSTLEDIAYIATAHLLFSTKFRSPNGFNYRNLVKVKSIATPISEVTSGPKSESYQFKWHAGAVCRKHLSHKQMARQLTNPQILLLACGISYDRSSDTGKLSSLDTLLEQEKSYMGILVDKISSLHPDLIFVERTVSRHAQELLRGRGIAVVLNVKRDTLNRIARCTNATVLTSVDHVDQEDPADVLGTCRSFYAKTFQVVPDADTSRGESPGPAINRYQRRGSFDGNRESGSKVRPETYLYMDGCDPLNGCTVVVKGPSKKKLRVLKAVVRYVLSLTYRILLEAHVLSDLEMGTLHNSLESTIPTFVMAPEGVVSASERTVWCTTCTLRRGDHTASSTSFGSNRGSHCYQCSGAKHVGIAMYSEDDISLGNFLAKEMESLTFKCHNPKCNYVMADHIQTFSCRSGTVTVSFEELPEQKHTHVISNGNAKEINVLTMLAHANIGDEGGNGGDQNEDDSNSETSAEAEENSVCPTVVFWRWCRECGGVISPFVQLNKYAYKYSFARLLEIWFTEVDTRKSGLDGDIPLPKIQSCCSHDRMRDHVLFFNVGNIVARFDFARRVPISLTNCAALRRQLSPNTWGKMHSTENDSSLVEDENYEAQVNEQIANLRALLTKLVAEFTVKIEGVERAVEACEERDALYAQLVTDVDSARQVVLDDESDFLQSLRALEVQNLKTRLMEYDACKRSMYHMACRWIAALMKLRVVIKDGIGRRSSSSNLLASPFKFPGAFSFGTPTTQSPADSPRRHTTPNASVRSLLELIDETEDDAEPRDGTSNNGSNADVAVDNSTPRVIAPPPSNSDADDDLLTVQCEPLSSNTSLSPPPSPSSTNSPQSSDATSTTAAIAMHKAEEKNNQEMSWKHVLWDIYHVLGKSKAGDDFELNLPDDIVEGHPCLPPGASGIAYLVYDGIPITHVAFALASETYEEQLSAWKYRVHEEAAATLEQEQVQQQRRNSVSSQDDAPALSTNWSRAALNTSMSEHFKYSFSDLPRHVSLLASGKSASVYCPWECSVTAYYALQFEVLRELFYGSLPDFLFSISHVSDWSTSGGKSGASFFRTLDNRFIVKHVSWTELQSFLEALPEYFKYMSKLHFDGSPSVLSKTLGLYQVTVAKQGSNQKVVHNVIVMENAFYQQRVARIYDLKGSTRNRYAKNADEKSGTQLDSNFSEFMQGHPLGILAEDHTLLFRALKNDTAFLRSINIVDFSMVVGFGGASDDSSETFTQMSVGIIDYLRQFDFIKRVESVSKSVGMIAGQASPTIIEPALYCKRFTDAMHRYFMPVTPILSRSNEPYDR